MSLYSVIYIVMVGLASVTVTCLLYYIVYELFIMRDGSYHVMVAVIFKAVLSYIEPKQYLISD